MQTSTLVDVATAARYLGIGRSTLYRWTAAGSAPRSLKLGARRPDRRVFTIAELDSWLRERSGRR
jgi:excisionase family DNA binding protein